MGTTTLKLEGTNGDLKEITTSEENYLAYQCSGATDDNLIISKRGGD